MAKKRVARRPKPKVRTEDRKHRVRGFTLGEGLKTITAMREEIEDMNDVLMGRADPPVRGRLSLMEVADAYYARASEMTRLIQGKELDGEVDKGSALYKFRTGELRTFMEMCKRAADLGSRRLTEDSLRYEMERLGRESAGRD